MARYGRQSMLQWDEVSVREFLRHHASIAELVHKENALSGAAENNG